MANPRHRAILKKGVKAWNKWRERNPGIIPDLSGIQLGELDSKMLWKATGEMTEVAYLAGSGGMGKSAVLKNIKFKKLPSYTCDLSDINFEDVNLTKANLSGGRIMNANLRGARLSWAYLVSTNLTGSDLGGADLSETDLADAKLIGTNLTNAMLHHAHLIETDFSNAIMINCRIYGASVWGVSLSGAIQENLVITGPSEPTITADNLEVAQFLYLLLNNEKIRDVINTITTKVVLILGRFTPERKAVLDAIREELRKRDYLPVLFDFDKPATRDITETMRTLAHLSRFIIADISDPSSIPLELQAVVPDLAVPVQPLLLSGQREFSMFVDLRKKYHWVLATHQYTDINDLLASLGDKVIAPAEQKAKELEKR